MMEIRFRTLCLALFLFLIGESAKAQNTDGGNWLGFGISTPIVDDLDFGLEIENRTANFGRSFDKFLIESGLDYSILKDLRIGISYRFAIEGDAELQRELAQRFSASLRYKLEVDDFEFKFKSSLQYSLDEFHSAFFDVRNKLINRNSVGVDYNWFGSKITPWANFELFHYLNNSGGVLTYKYRTKVGANYPIGSSLDVDVFYLYDHEFNVVNPSDRHVVGVSFSYDF